MCDAIGLKMIFVVAYWPKHQKPYSDHFTIFLDGVDFIIVQLQDAPCNCMSEGFPACNCTATVYATFIIVTILSAVDLLRPPPLGTNKRRDSVILSELSLVDNLDNPLHKMQ